MQEVHVKVMPANRRRTFRRGPFQIERISIGLINGEAANDTGIAGLGLIDHAHLSEGLLVAMHNHRNDEIISYICSGQMIHEDSYGKQAILEPGHIMVMNAGSGISHEESVPTGEVRMLQIFVRPESDDLPPLLQFQRFNPIKSINAWRKVFGPKGTGAPLFVRQRVMMQEVAIEAGHNLELPSYPGFDTAYLYIIEGGARVSQRLLLSGDSSSWESGIYLLMEGVAAITEAVLFLIDTTAQYTRSGTLSG